MADSTGNLNMCMLYALGQGKMLITTQIPIMQPFLPSAISGFTRQAPVSLSANATTSFPQEGYHSERAGERMCSI